MNKQILVVLLFVLFSMNVAAQDTLYSETFANGSLENMWYPDWNGNNMEVEFMSGNPSGDSWVGKLGNDLSTGFVGTAFSGDPTWTDFRLEAWVYVPVAMATSATYYGIEFRADSVGQGGSGYQFLARFREDLSNQALRFRARVGATPTVIKDWTAAEIPGGIPTADGWHHMAVEAIGNQFRFFFDGNELPGGPYTDNTFTSGWIGAYIWDFAVVANLFIDDIYVINTSTGIDEPKSEITSGYDLHQNFPNPFNPNTTISFDLANQELVRLDIYNNLGQKIRSLINNQIAAGPHQVQWDGRDDLGQEAPAGVYYSRILAGSFQATNKMLLVK